MVVVAGWGALRAVTGWFEADLFYLGRAAGSGPGHPLYLPSTAPVGAFRAVGVSASSADLGARLLSRCDGLADHTSGRNLRLVVTFGLNLWPSAVEGDRRYLTKT